MSEPRTAAGRAVAETLTVALVARPHGGGKTWDENAADARAAILAVEQEAAALDVRALVRALHAGRNAAVDDGFRQPEAWYVAREYEKLQEGVR